jgi:hypothetical protein
MRRTEYVFLSVAIFAMLGGTIRCSDGQPSRHEDAQICRRFCADNGMEVSSWNGEYPGKSCPNCGCMCRPR